MLYGLSIFIFFLLVMYCLFLSQNNLDYAPKQQPKINQEMKYERKLELLDKILDALYNSGYHQLDYKALNKETYAYYLTYDGHNPATFAAFIDPSDELGNALDYLAKEGLISFHPPNVNLNFKGILKLSAGGFVQEYKSQVLRNRRDNEQYERLKDFHETSKIRNIVMMSLGVVGFIISLFTLGNQLSS